MPPNLKSIQVDLTAEIMNATTKQKVKFNQGHSFSILTNQTASNEHMSLPYLRKVKGSYEVSFLGRNGEPAAKKKVSIRMKHALAHQKSAHLITDK